MAATFSGVLALRLHYRGSGRNACVEVLVEFFSYSFAGHLVFIKSTNYPEDIGRLLDLVKIELGAL